MKDDRGGTSCLINPGADHQIDDGTCEQDGPKNKKNFTPGQCVNAGVDGESIEAFGQISSDLRQAPAEDEHANDEDDNTVDAK
ncbi:MAG TPA: hypothetical protein VGN88_01885 [Phycisphaerae bacterium]